MSHTKTRAPESTLEEAKYLRYLADHQVPVHVKLSDNQIMEGTIEFFDESFVRLTRQGHPNLFLFKHDIKYIMEMK